MNKFKVTLSMVSPFKTELASTTIFGGLCWAYKDIYGVEKLEKFLDSMVEDKEDKDILTVSGAFREGYISIPCFMHNTGNYTVAEIASIKKEQKNFENNIQNIECTVHCEIPREGCNEAQVRSEIQYESSFVYTVYVYTTLDREVIERSFKLLAMRGLGGKISKGLGKFEVKSIEDFEGFNEAANGYMLISDYIPKKTDSNIGVCKARLVRGSKTFDNRTKGTYYKLLAGSWFRRISDPQEVYGRAFKDPVTGVTINGTAIAFPINH